MMQLIAVKWVWATFKKQYAKIINNLTNKIMLEIGFIIMKAG